MKPKIILEQDRVALRAFSIEDAELLLRWRNSNQVRPFMATSHLISSAEHMRWVRRMLEGTLPNLLIFELNEVPCGMVNVSDYIPVHERVHWGFYLGEVGLPKGTGLRMLSLTLDYLFYHRHIRKVCGEVIASNMRSLRVHERLGFKREGTLKYHYIKNGKTEDAVLYGRFENNWQAHRKQLEEWV